MKRAAIAAGLMVVTLTAAGEVVGQSSSADRERRQREAKARHDKAIADMKRKHPNLARDIDRTPGTGSQPSHRGLPPVSDPRGSTTARMPSAPVFQAASAGAPAECLRAYVNAARSASTMEQILPYLPQAEARSLKEHQATYDPREAAKSREQHRKRSPHLSESSLDHLTNSPYANALKRHQRIAAKILDVLRVEIDGNKAMISVSTISGAKVNGVEYPYGTADIEMVGEGNEWKVASYNDDNIAYLDPPQPK